MNSFAHALPFLDRNPLFAIGCALPDWLGAVDRRCRVRKQKAVPFLQDEDELVAQVAGGIIQHIDDDRWFHSGEPFTTLNMQFAVELRKLLVGEPGFRPGFLGHIIIELILDGYLHERFSGRLDQFYGYVEEADPEELQAAVNRMATRPTEKLVGYFPIFLREQYLYDYGDDQRLMYRVNHVLRRVKLEPVGDEIQPWLPDARNRVYDSAGALLSGYELQI